MTAAIRGGLSFGAADKLSRSGRAKDLREKGLEPHDAYENFELASRE